MKTTQMLHQLGQSLWLDNLTREMLDGGRLRQLIDDYSITGLTSNPTIFDEAIGSSSSYDADIRRLTQAGFAGESLFMRLARDDVRRAADLFRPAYEASKGVDGWASMEVSPLIAADTQATIEAAAGIHRQFDRPNILVKIPGTPAGVEAIEASIFNGVPINVTLLFSREQYLASAEAYMRGIERRLAAGRTAKVPSVASLFVSRWDKSVADKVPPELRNHLGIAVAGQTYHAYRQLLATSRWHTLAAAGAQIQRLLWASTGTKDPAAPETLYIQALAAPDTINTMPEKTLQAFAEHGQVTGIMADDGREAEAMSSRFARAGFDLGALAGQLQREGAQSFVKSWQELLTRISAKAASLTHAA